MEKCAETREKEEGMSPANADRKQTAQKRKIPRGALQTESPCSDGERIEIVHWRRK